MKIAISLLVALAGLQIGFSQKSDPNEPNLNASGDGTVTENFLDLQARSLSGIFGSDFKGSPDGETLDFLEMLEQAELPADQKEELKKQYYLQAREPSQKQRDSLAVTFKLKLMEAQSKETKN